MHIQLRIPTFNLITLCTIGTVINTLRIKLTPYTDRIKYDYIQLVQIRIENHGHTVMFKDLTDNQQTCVWIPGETVSGQVAQVFRKGL